MQGAYRKCYFPQHLLGNLFPLIEGFHIELVDARIHDFHAYPDVALAEHGAIELNGVRASGRSHRYVQVHEQALCLYAVHSCSDSLKIYNQ